MTTIAHRLEALEAAVKPQAQPRPVVTIEHRRGVYARAATFERPEAQELTAAEVKALEATHFVILVELDYDDD